MATLSTIASTSTSGKTANRTASSNRRSRSAATPSKSTAAQTSSDERPIQGFRVKGMVSDFFHGTTKPAAGKAAQPYIRFKIDGTTPSGKKITRTVMGFGAKAIEWLDVSAKTREAGIFVAFDRRGNNSNVLVPMGPYQERSSYEG